LHRRIPGDEVSPDDVSLGSRSQDDAVRIPDDRVVLDRVVVIAGSNKADAEVAPLGQVAISA
jgi:hypothetical protein